MKPFRYETHLHTWPISKCAKATVKESLKFYKELGYDGVFITNHFIDCNINYDKSAPYEELIRFFFSEYDQAKKIGEELGIRVFFAAEMGYKGTDFLVYGPDKAWFLAHPELMELKKSQQLEMLAEHGALIIHAHPFREAKYIDHIRLFPRFVEGVEIYNASRTDFENRLAAQYAENYDLLPFAGSDNHKGSLQPLLGGMEGETPILDEAEFIQRVREKSLKPFRMENPAISE